VFFSGIREEGKGDDVFLLCAMGVDLDDNPKTPEHHKSRIEAAWRPIKNTKEGHDRRAVSREEANPCRSRLHGRVAVGEVRGVDLCRACGFFPCNYPCKFQFISVQ
jgi:hypothetical protein